MSAATCNPPPDSFMLTEVLIFTGHEFIEDGFVLVKNGKVEQVGSGTVPSPENIPVLSKPGCTLLPGLIDAHIHALGGNVESIEQSIRFGVTTVCDMHNEAKHNNALQKLASNFETKGQYSDFKCAGLGAIIAGGWPEPVVRREFEHMGKPEIAEKMIASWPKFTSPSGAAAFVMAQIEESGASYIKLMHELGDTLSIPNLPRPPPQIQKAVVDAAHEHGLIAVGHAFSHAGASDLLAAGVDGLTHCFFDKPPNDDWLQVMKQHNVHCNPTLSLCASQVGEGGEMQRRFAECPLAQRMLFDPQPRKDIGLACGMHNASKENAFENTRAMYRADVPLIVGSDCAGQEIGSAYGLGVHMEMYYMVHEVGMRPDEVLRSATSLTAERFGLNDRGVHEVGRLADIVLLEGDVRESMLDQSMLCLPISGVWREGILADVYRS